MKKWHSRAERKGPFTTQTWAGLLTNSPKASHPARCLVSPYKEEKRIMCDVGVNRVIAAFEGEDSRDVSKPKARNCVVFARHFTGMTWGTSLFPSTGGKISDRLFDFDFQSTLRLLCALPLWIVELVRVDSSYFSATETNSSRKHASDIYSQWNVASLRIETESSICLLGSLKKNPNVSRTWPALWDRPDFYVNNYCSLVHPSLSGVQIYKTSSVK